jgi:hypothetical protein
MKNAHGRLQQSQYQQSIKTHAIHQGIKHLLPFLLALVIMIFITGCRESESALPLSPNAMTDNSQGLSGEPENTPVSEPIPTFTSVANDPTSTPMPAEQPNYGILWSTGFESNNLKDYYETHGEFIRQSNYASYSIVNDPVLNGRHAVALTIDTQLLASGRGAAAYLFYYNNPDAGWYSAWIFIPEDTQPLSWWNIWQWKSTFNGNSDQSVPMWILDLAAIPNRDDLQMKLVFRPDSNALKRPYTNPAATINKGEWVHISTYYQKSMDTDGIVAVWINGEEFYRVENVQTTETDNTLYWSINHYSETILPHPSSIYIDDVIISSERIDPSFRLP